MNFGQRLKNKDGQLRQRIKLASLAMLVLVLITVAVGWVVSDQAHRLEEAQLSALKPMLMQARKNEIQHFVQAGRKVLAHFCAKAKTDPNAREEGRALLRLMDFGEKTDDNYFFVYQLDGVNVMHPRKLGLVGKSLWDFTDQKDGTFVIRRLIAQALAGGGFVTYHWDRPSTNRIEPKLGYVELVPECNWMVGTGLYLDHLREAEDIIRVKTEQEVRTTRDKIALAALAALLIVAAGGLVVNLSEQRTANERLRAMAQKVVQSQELERTRVARELHDGVTQSLASVKYIFESADIQLDRGKTQAASVALKAGIEQTIGVMIDVRRISHDLYPTILDDAGLGLALEQLGREFGTRTRIPLAVEIEEIRKMQKEAAKTLYRFTQQALGNIEMHAHARHIKISLRQNKGILLRVEDDGVGFDAETVMHQRREGLGLTNLRERIEMFGGTFAVQSSPGKTILSAYLPPESIQPDERHV
jgi:two-component system NarL family sensor kinase